ncbi:hypothetical protein Kpho02_67750 [Kitasatospora phosalacinea]|uniref:Methyltransferase type 11 domain-containing protein n=1 Tax=Kitasatospora phosalacinea TaxID=2065 RepID=A0A9W6V6Q0_9ACTN|nr:hypothetical protein Kpho02_67750 [Kitasatospora phosalacinea]
MQPELADVSSQGRPHPRASTLKRLTHLAGHKGIVELGQTDLQRPIPWPDSSADAVVSYNVLECLPDPAGLIREAARLLKPGGRLVLAHVDFDSIMVGGTPVDLDRRVCHAFADDRQPWMDHADGRMGRAIPGLIAASALTEQ